VDSTLYTQYNIDNTVGSLTQFQKSLITGTILGDGYLRILPRSKNALLEINHSFTQKEYVDWKFTSLKNLVKSLPKTRKGSQKRVAYRFYTKQLSELSEIYNSFYRDKKKIVPDNLSLDAVSLAVWYMDDGSRCSNSDAYLNTQQFSVEDQKKLILALKKLGLETRLNKDKNYFRLRFVKSSLPKLKNLLEKQIIPSMQYKLSFTP